MKAKTIVTLAIIIAGLLTNYSFSQTLGLKNNLQFGNFRPDGGGGVMNIEIMPTFFTKKDKTGFNAWNYSNAQMVFEKPVTTFFALGAGFRIPFKSNAPFPSFIEAGMGMGFQTIPKPEMVLQEDGSWRETNVYSPMRGMGYINAQFGVQVERNKFRQISIQGMTHLSFDPSKKETIFTYFYRASILMQVTDSPKDINLHLGLHAESILAHGFAFAAHMDRNRVQLKGVVGVNFDPNNNHKPGFSFGYGVLVNL